MKRKKWYTTFALLITLALLPTGRTLATTAWATGLIQPNEPVYLVFKLDDTEQLLMYGLGPTVAQTFWHPNAVLDPEIALYRIVDGQWFPINSNDNWQSHATANDVAVALDALDASIVDAEAAMLLTLRAGRYVLEVRNTDPNISGYAAAGVTGYDGDVDGGGDPGPGPGSITPGAWTGSSGNYSVCFFVASDGRSLTPRGSSCPGGNALVVDYFNGMVGNCDDDDADVDYDDADIDIENNSFEFGIETDFFFFDSIQFNVVGTFSGGVLNGSITKAVDGISCTGQFTATPQ